MKLLWTVLILEALADDGIRYHVREAVQRSIAAIQD